MVHYYTNGNRRSTQAMVLMLRFDNALFAINSLGIQWMTCLTC